MSLAISCADSCPSRFDEIIGDAMADLFATMVPLPLEAVGPAEIRPARFTDSFSALIGFVGDLKGMIGLHFETKLAQSCYQAMLGFAETGPDNEVRDLVGEMANMLAGSVKTGLCQAGEAIEISVPQMFSGRCYQVHLPAGGKWSGWYFRVENANMLVELKQLD